jgi:hypothetical protein
VPDLFFLELSKTLLLVEALAELLCPVSLGLLFSGDREVEHIESVPHQVVLYLLV